MKKIYFLLIGLVLLAAMILPANLVFAAAPDSFTVTYNQAQFQWRGKSPFGDWTPGYSYQNDSTSSDFVVTGNTLHTNWSYSPAVTNLTGTSTVYTFDKASGLWIEHEGTISYNYVPGYGNYPVTNYFRGYLDFGRNPPSSDNFVHGVAYQWAYLFAPQDAILTGQYTQYAHWDSKVGAWLVGFSIYLWDNGTQNYMDTVTVSSNAIAGASSSILLTPGKEYTFIASGTWENDGNNVADAEYTSIDGWSTQMNGYDISPYFLGEGECDLQVNHEFVDWGSYSDDHVYSLQYIGTGAEVNFRIFDGDSNTGEANSNWYSDNNGYLTVNIILSQLTFPDPFIEPIPANNYNPLGL